MDRGVGGYSPWGPKELDMTERLTLSLKLFLVLEARSSQFTL